MIDIRLLVNANLFRLEFYDKLFILFVSRSDEFYVVSEKNGKVLDIADVVKDKKTTLTMVVMHAKKYPPPKSQLWYTTKDGGLLYSSLNDTVFTGHGDYKDLFII